MAKLTETQAKRYAREMGSMLGAGGDAIAEPPGSAHPGWAVQFLVISPEAQFLVNSREARAWDAVESAPLTTEAECETALTALGAAREAVGRWREVIRAAEEAP